MSGNRQFFKLWFTSNRIIQRTCYRTKICIMNHFVLTTTIIYRSFSFKWSFLTWIFTNHGPYGTRQTCLLSNRARAVFDRFLISRALDSMINRLFIICHIFAYIYCSCVTQLPTDHMTRLACPAVYTYCAPLSVVIYLDSSWRRFTVRHLWVDQTNGPFVGCLVLEKTTTTTNQ